MVFESFFGAELLKGKDKIATSEVEGKSLMIYFSAHWCGPCRMFTPSLIKFYNDLKAQRSDFDLVFVSSDRDQHAFDEYYGEMPWLALPYPERKLKEKLSSKYKVRGIPTLVVVDKDGNLITTNGRSEVMQHPDGAGFPWNPPTLDQVLGTEFIGANKETVKAELKGRVFGLYFSAQWCPPCHRFTPVLVERYKELKKEHPDFEIVFVSSDRDQHAFDEYHGEMPWLAIPLSDKARAQKLSELYEVEGIPTLVIVDKDLSTITTNGVSAVYQKLEYPFRPKPLNELSEDTISEINDSPALIVFGPAEEADQIAKTLQPIAEEFAAAKKGITFFYTKDAEIVPNIRQFANVPAAEKLVILLLDIPSQRKFVSPDKEVTEAGIRAFLKGYLDETLPALPIKG